MSETLLPYAAWLQGLGAGIVLGLVAFGGYGHTGAIVAVVASVALITCGYLVERRSR